MPSLAVDDTQQLNIFDQAFETEFFTPSTVTSYTDEIEPSITESMAEEYLPFYADLNNEKYSTYTLPQHTESHGQSVSSPTESMQSSETDLLDLESFNYTNMWESPDDLTDPDWTPTTIVTEKSASSSLPTSIRSEKIKLANSSKSAQTSGKATKRRSSSITSEIELQIEIEESTKRAKRCTVPLTEEQKRLRRKELNRLAAQRCRSKRKGHAEILEEEIDELTKKNRDLRERLEELETTKTELYDVIKFHFSNCHNKPQ